MKCSSSTARSSARCAARACRSRPRRRSAALLTLAATLLLAGCQREPAVVIYTSVDQQFAQHVLAEFTRRSGIRVDAVYDSEAGKTTGLVRRLEREARRPRCDVWWSSEIFGTIALARAGVLTPFVSDSAADIPREWKDAAGLWTAGAARCRVLAYNTQRVTPAELPLTWRELLEGEWAARLAIANPQFGTTRGHVAAMFAYWGAPAGRAALQNLRDRGARIADGNGPAVQLVAAGVVDVCLTDTDDVWVAQQRGLPVNMVYPRLDRDLPPMWIPCTVALVKGAPNREAAGKLIDFLVSAEVEKLLAASDSRNVPVRGQSDEGTKGRRDEGGQGRREAGANDDPAPEPLDWGRIADALEPAMEAAREILLR